MTTVNVLFLANCADDAAGERKAINVKRAQRLARTGYVRVLDGIPETAVLQPAEDAARARPLARGPKPERRG
jgi:hypothetical protein